MTTRPDSLRHWEYFVAVAEEGSVTGAAERLRLTQSPVSQGLKRLESNLGLDLIRRSATGATLTEAGRSLLPQARILVRDATELQSMAHAITDAGAEVRVGLAPSVPPGIAFDLTSALRDVGRVSVHTAEVSQLVTRVGEGRLDCAVIEDPAPTGELSRGQLHEVPRLLAGPAEKPATWAALRGHTLLDNTAAVSPAAAGRLADAFFTIGLHPETELWPDRTALAARLGAGGAMVLLTPDQLGGLPAFPMPTAFHLRLRCVVPPQRGGAVGKRDLRDVVDRALRRSLGRLGETG